LEVGKRVSVEVHGSPNVAKSQGFGSIAEDAIACGAITIGYDDRTDAMDNASTRNNAAKTCFLLLNVSWESPMI
jgi:hypothetical protein